MLIISRVSSTLVRWEKSCWGKGTRGRSERGRGVEAGGDGAVYRRLIGAGLHVIYSALIDSWKKQKIKFTRNNCRAERAPKRDKGCRGAFWTTPPIKKRPGSARNNIIYRADEPTIKIEWERGDIGRTDGRPAKSCWLWCGESAASKLTPQREERRWPCKRNIVWANKTQVVIAKD